MSDKKRLSDMLDTLELVDADLAPEDFEPEALVGDIRGKVDSIKWRLDSWRSQAETLQKDWIDPLARRKKAILGKMEKLKAYVAEQMASHSFETLPGNMFRVDLRPSPPALRCLEEASEVTFIKRFPYVLAETVYRWNNDLLREKLASEPLPFATLTQGVHIKFETKKD